MSTTTTTPGKYTSARYRSGDAQIPAVGVAYPAQITAWPPRTRSVVLRAHGSSKTSMPSRVRRKRVRMCGRRTSDSAWSGNTAEDDECYDSASPPDDADPPSWLPVDRQQVRQRRRRRLVADATRRTPTQCRLRACEQADEARRYGEAVTRVG